MKITGSKQRLCCGAWLLAAILLGGFNVFELMSLEAQSTVGYSRTLLELQANLQRLDAILLPEFFNPSPAVSNAPAGRPPTQVQTESRDRASEPTPLPMLSGVIRTLDPNGSVHFQAVLNGRSYREKDRLDDFTVDQITSAGVVLRRTEQTWFIPCPTPIYSSDQGE